MASIDSSRFVTGQKKAASAPTYGDANYWSVRYSTTVNEPFDWYVRWEQLKESLTSILDPEKKPKILVLGCGTSTLSEEMYAEGFEDITNVDSCQELVEALREKHQDKENMKYESFDARRLPQAFAEKKKQLEEERLAAEAGKEPEDKEEGKEEEKMEEEKKEEDFLFDLVIDKACLDCIACAQDSKLEIHRLLLSVSRVLKPGTGIYVCISHAPPDLRQPMLVGIADFTRIQSQKYKWTYSHETLPRLLSNPLNPPGAKDKIEFTPSAAFRSKEHVYNMYMCHKL
mmetsp:Transcript_110908/g.192289  ORF Transcript_110908/g.192289 Transcript_110908/m.192289 type:complete len:286 (+) Transcript_110908:111-968(+)